MTWLIIYTRGRQIVNAFVRPHKRKAQVGGGLPWAGSCPLKPVNVFPQDWKTLKQIFQLKQATVLEALPYSSATAPTSRSWQSTRSRAFQHYDFDGAPVMRESASCTRSSSSGG
jgi:hypothetical protein